MLWVCLSAMNGCVCACEHVRVCTCVFPSTEAEKLYQRRVLTITGICVALLVVGIVCVVAYCKTKYVSLKGTLMTPHSYIAPKPAVRRM